LEAVKVRCTVSCESVVNESLRVLYFGFIPLTHLVFFTLCFFV
jgi:hypothetical protein